MLEGALFNEWHFLANISGARTGAGEVGVLIHASLASKAHRVDIVRPPDINDAEWCEAVEGRILHLQVDMQLPKRVVNLEAPLKNDWPNLNWCMSGQASTRVVKPPLANERLIQHW